MKALNILPLFLFCFFISYGQTPPVGTGMGQQPKVYEAVQKDAAFPGGPDAFLKLTANRIKYPAVARLVKVTGKVNVRFTVGKDGLVKNARALDSIGFGCEEAAVNAVSSTIRWMPALQNGVPVDVNFTLPITFSTPVDKNDTFDLSELKASDYAFIFQVKDTIYTIDNVAAVLKATSIPQSRIISVAPHTDKEQFPHPGKKDIYLVKLKG